MIKRYVVKQDEVMRKSKVVHLIFYPKVFVIVFLIIRVSRSLLPPFYDKIFRVRQIRSESN